MTTVTVGTRADWLAARRELLQAEKRLTRLSDELAVQRRALPWVPVEKEYRFTTEDGEATLADLFAGRSQLLVYHFMFGPDYTAGCPSCSAIADGFNGFFTHLANHDVGIVAISRAPLPQLLAYRERMGWSFPWVSSHDSDFNYDFAASFTESELGSGSVEYNFTQRDVSGLNDPGRRLLHAEMSGVAPTTYLQEHPGMSAFALKEGVVHHTYSTYARGLDAIWGMYPWLDRAPLGRNEHGPWWRRHDEYPSA